MIRLEVLQGHEKGRVFESEAPEIVIGRAASATLVVQDSHLSGEHGLLFRDADQVLFRDLRSTNGSMVLRGTKRFNLDGSDRWECRLEDGDRILLGDATSPVILHYRHIPADDVTTKASNERILAQKGLNEVPELVGKIEHSPDIGAIYRAVRTLGGHSDLSQVLDAIATATFSLVGRATHVAILLSNEKSPDRYIPAIARRRDEDNGSHDTIMMSRTVLRKVLEDKAGILAANAPDVLGNSESIMGASIHSTLGVPLRRGSDIIGVIEADNRGESGLLREHDLDVMLVLAEQAALALDNAILLQQLRNTQQDIESENNYLRSQQGAPSFDRIVGESPAMKAVFQMLERVIDTRATVCIGGETGTGKELIARAIHHQGRRRDRMFVAQNCAALPENLLESELFGHKRGAFTGANQDKKGLFEIADGGTLFLDEIAEMPLILQAKLLRVLQEGELRPLGSTQTKQIDVRIICATHQNLDSAVKAGTFRQDLFYRIMVFPVILPPLRERQDDIPALCRHFLNRYTRENRKTIMGISQEATNQLMMHHWPGNIRELENEVQRMVIHADDNTMIGVEHLSENIRHPGSALTTSSRPKGSLKQAMESVERTFLRDALTEHNGNKTKTAQALGITREGLHKKLSKHGI